MKFLKEKMKDQFCPTFNNYKIAKIFGSSKGGWFWELVPVQIKKFECKIWRHDTQHNDIQHNDTQHNDVQHYAHAEYLNA